MKKRKAFLKYFQIFNTKGGDLDWQLFDTNVTFLNQEFL